MSDQPDRAILAIIPCECECGNKWNEQEIITRSGTGYSYNLDIDTYTRILRRELVVEGIRTHNTRKCPVCYRCLEAPHSTYGWRDQAFGIEYYDPQTEEMKEAWKNQPRRVAPRLTKASESERAAKAKETINKLLDMD